MTYQKPELLLIGAAQGLVLGSKDLTPLGGIPDTELGVPNESLSRYNTRG